jgi:hypothetical protein
MLPAEVKLYFLHQLCLLIELNKLFLREILLERKHHFQKTTKTSVLNFGSKSNEIYLSKSTNLDIYEGKIFMYEKRQKITQLMELTHKPNQGDSYWTCNHLLDLLQNYDVVYKVFNKTYIIEIIN